MRSPAFSACYTWINEKADVDQLEINIHEWIRLRDSAACHFVSEPSKMTDSHRCLYSSRGMKLLLRTNLRVVIRRYAGCSISHLMWISFAMIDPSDRRCRLVSGN